MRTVFGRNTEPHLNIRGTSAIYKKLSLLPTTLGTPLPVPQTSTLPYFLDYEPLSISNRSQIVSADTIRERREADTLRSRIVSSPPTPKLILVSAANSRARTVIQLYKK